MSYIIAEYWCEPCQLRNEAMVERPAPERHECANCGGEQERVLSAPKTKTVYGTVDRGKNEPPPPHVMDTRPLAEGMPLGEFRKRQKEKWRAERRKQVRTWTA